MRPLFRLGLCLTLFARLLPGQPTAPGSWEITRLQAMSEIDPRVQADGEPWNVDISNREQARQFFRALYGASENVPSGWDGNTGTGVPGTTTDAFKAAVRNRVNFYRAYAGVPAAVTFNSTFSAKAQQAALMMSANHALSHTPPTSWTFYTADGAEAAGKSNIGIGTFGPDTMDGYMQDYGSGNTIVGHRRWILYPQTQEMGTGDVEAQDGRSPANALWVQDAQIFGSRPATRDEAVAWPPKGHVPFQLVWPRWSLSYPGADFANATVAMTRNGAAISASVEAQSSSAGAPEPTVIWLYDGKVGTDLASHDRPSSDVVYGVTVSNVMVGGNARIFSYTVTVFDPDVAGSGFSATTITGTTTPSTAEAHRYTVATPSFGSGFQWRELSVSDTASSFGAENGLQGVIDGSSASYTPRTTGTTASGNGAYHLAHPEPTTQTLTLPETYWIPTGTNVALNFKSRLGTATTAQIARVEVSLNDGAGWSQVYEQIGAGQPGETSFQTRSIDLATYAGQTLQVRFVYDYTNGNYFPQTSDAVGWFIDDIVVSGAKTMTTLSTSGHTTGSTFDYTASSTGIKGLQARGMFFGTYAMDWGPVLLVTANSATSNGGGNGGGNSSSSRIVNMSVRSVSGPGAEALNVGMVIGGSGAKSVLLRVVGPTLSIGYGLPGTAPDPRLELKRSVPGSEPVLIAENDNWGETSSLRTLFSSLGAFPFVSPLDSALLTTQNTGVYPAIVDTKGASGIVLVEAYDTEAVASGTARLINVSARSQVGTGGDVLVAGFVISGTGTKTVLIRGIGPTLGEYGVPNVLANPQLKVSNNVTGETVNTNDDWNFDASLATTASTVGAFELLSAQDAVLKITLPPGVYTATVSGVGETTGIALVEVYEVN